jgi:hypothetical protein
MAVTSSFGVTSKAGLNTLTPSGAVLVPKPSVISVASLSSIGISAPVFVYKSIVDIGAAT